jgi:hypothetical protein
LQISDKVTKPMNTNTQRPYSWLLYGLIGAAFGLFLGAFAYCILMKGTWAYVLALVGGFCLSIIARSGRILDRDMKGLMIGLGIGFLASLIKIILLGMKVYIPTNLWAGAVYVLTQGIVRAYVIPDSMLANWLGRHSPRQKTGKKQ